ncbi:MAG: maleylacetate reductase [Acidimicrobiia bacterium]|nr:maleylacetate reductase [Acidimicrobiia bacterium]
MESFVEESAGGRVVFGAGRVADVADEVDRLALRRVFLITSPSSRPTGDRIGLLLGDRVAARWSEVREHVPVALAEQARLAAREVQAAGIVAVGGGSAIGLAKAVALTEHLPILAVPTTYSGSEMTPIWGLTGERKTTGRDLRVKPATVVYDPETTLTLPAGATATSAFNALAHCVEALYAPAANPQTSLLAGAGIRAIVSSLPAAVSDPGGIEARSELLYGAWLAGATLEQAGTALHHKLCHILGGSHGVGHGDANAVLLPHVVAFNAQAAAAELAPLRDALHTDDAAGALWELARTAGTPASLQELGVGAEDLDSVATRAVEETTGNPRPLSVPAVRALLDDAWSGRPPRLPD